MYIIKEVKTSRKGAVHMRTNEKISEATVQSESGNQWVFSYYLQSVPSINEGELYALRVDKSDLDGTLLESEETFPITDSRREALAMAKAFAAGTVPPGVLMEMADEWVMQNTPVHTYHRAG
jgi:hypothetical protein